MVQLIGKRFDENPACVTTGYLSKNAIPLDRWSRVGAPEELSLNIHGRARSCLANRALL